MATLKYGNHGNYTKAALAAADLKVNMKKFYDLLADSPANSARDLSGSTVAGPKPEFDRIDPISRATLRQEIVDVFDASTNKNFGTEDLLKA